MKRNQIWWGITASAGMLMLILDSSTALNGAKEGLALCIQSLIPSLFPFFVLSSLLTGALLGTDLPFLRPIGKLLQIPDGCESLLIPGFLGGYPAGAQCIGQAFRQGNISEANARRLLLFCNNAGPSFLFGVLGPMFPEKWMLWALWGIQISAALFCARCFPGHQEKNTVQRSTGISINEALSGSVRTMGAVCGWVVLFRTGIAFAGKWGLRSLPVAAQVLVTGLLELSNGCLGLLSVDDIRVRFLLCSAMLSLGGMCVAMQTASVIGSLSLCPYLGGKLLQCIFSLCIGISFLYHKPLYLLLPVVLWWFLKKTVAKRSSLVYNKPINSRRNQYAFSEKNRKGLHVLSSGYSAGGGTDSLHQAGSALSRR